MSLFLSPQAVGSNEVKEAILTIHEQGLFPSERCVRSKLSDPDIMRRKEGREMWSSVMVEPGYSTDVWKTDYIR